MNKIIWSYPSFMIGFMIGAICGLFCVATTTNDFHSQAIKHHAAHYDPQTAEFRWNDEVKP